MPFVLHRIRHSAYQSGIFFFFTSCCFRVAFGCWFFFFFLMLFPKQLLGFYSTTRDSLSAQAMFTWGCQAENSCWFCRDGTWAHMFNTSAVLKARYHSGCPLSKLHGKHPKDLGYTRHAVCVFSAISSFLFPLSTSSLASKPLLDHFLQNRVTSLQRTLVRWYGRWFRDSCISKRKR